MVAFLISNYFEIKILILSNITIIALNKTITGNNPNINNTFSFYVISMNLYILYPVFKNIDTPKIT